MTTLEQLAVDVFEEDADYDRVYQSAMGDNESNYKPIKILRLTRVTADAGDLYDYFTVFEMAQLNDIASDLWEQAERSERVADIRGKHSDMWRDNGEGYNIK